ncbi:DUF2141 domain-containing protein [Sphingobium sp. H39-3-25]|uniref:DUF2141 domain-containing protein n=1 Tax=Sphingobium arseniciresistens TaxID=3030834 RepID=UPI0023B9E949|nr:DUF2141 domain-containing protein [Sphingobium arseniciresistens]
MLKIPAVSMGALVALMAAANPAPASAALGPQAATCERNGAAVLVHIDGFKERAGMLRVQLYAANEKTFLEKRQYLERIELPVTRSGAMEVCVAVPKAGNYALYVRHDVNGSGKSDRSDGGGFSGNPSVSLSDLVFKRKPPLSKTQFAVGDSTRKINVVLNYVQGLSFKPIHG